MFSAALYARVRFVFYPLHTRPRVQRASGIPCSLVFEGQRNAKLGQLVPRECGRASCLKLEPECHNVIASQLVEADQC
jgi:hypothetical protein